MLLDPGRRNRWQQWAVAAWTVVLAVVCIKAAGWPRSHSVYPILANASRNWETGADLYRHSSEPSSSLDVFRYSPLVAAGLMPLRVLPDSLGSIFWRLINAAVLLAGAGWWCRAVLPRPVTAPLRGILFLLVLPLCVGNFHNAQSNPLVLGLILAGAAAAAEERWTCAGICLAVACLFKLYPIAAGLLLVVVYPRQMALRLAAALALGLALPFFLQQPAYVVSQYQGWLESLCGDDRGVLSLDRCYRDLALLARLWHCPITLGFYRIVQAAAGAGMAVFCMVQPAQEGRDRPRLTLLTGLACCWMTALGPASESCTYILLAPPLAWALVDAWISSERTWTKLWLAAAYILLVTTYMSCWFPGRYHLQVFGLQPFAGLMFLAYLVTRAAARRRLSCEPYESRPQASSSAIPLGKSPQRAA